MSEPVRIEPYAGHHFDGVDALWRSVFPGDPPWNRAAVAVPAKLAVQPELFLVAVDTEDRVVGTVMGGYDGHRAWIYALAVAPAHRRRGVGRRLVEAVESCLRAAGAFKVNLQVRTTNTAVIAFYEGLGYAVEQRVSMGKHLGRCAGGCEGG